MAALLHVSSGRLVFAIKTTPTMLVGALLYQDRPETEAR